MSVYISKVRFIYLETTRSFFFTELLEKFILVCPDLEVLCVNNKSIKQFIGIDINNGDCLPYIRFKKLKTLHLYGPFQLDDGAFLLQVTI